MKMSKSKYEAAEKAYPLKYIAGVTYNEYEQSIFCEGYEKGEKDTVEKAVDWVIEHIWDYVKCNELFDTTEFRGIDEDGLEEDMKTALNGE